MSNVRTHLLGWVFRKAPRWAALAVVAMGGFGPVLGVEPRPIKALLITGGCCHDYDGQRRVLAEGISERARVEWTVIQEGATSVKHRVSVYEDPKWAEAYDVVVHNECFSDEKDPDWLEGIVRAHRNGTPAVVIHCAMHCYRAPSPEWFKFLGVTSHRHGPHFAYALRNLKPDHAIMKGFPPVWRTPHEELYNIVQLWPDAIPLGAGYSPETKKEEVCIWINEYGNGRVFGTTAGHYTHTMEQPVFLDLVARGLLWACRKLEDSGDPKPGYEPASKRTPAELGEWSAQQPFPAGETPVALFNGEDFEGWEGQIGTYWNIRHGMIIGANSKQSAPKASTYLTTRKHYRNFRLIFEGKLVTSEMHSGIAFWGRGIEKEGDPHSYQGHLVMFPSDFGFWDLYRRNSIYQDDGRAKAVGRQHEWNQMEILAIGDRIRFALNGKLVADWKDPQPDLCQPGPIGLQLHSNSEAQDVRFRGLILSENPKDQMITVRD